MANFSFNFSSSCTRFTGTPTHIRIDDDVTSIPNDAFHGNRVVVEVVLPEGLQEIGESAFGGCTSLQTITLPEGLLLSIGDGAFTGCSSLPAILIPGTVTSIGIAAFAECQMLGEAVFIEVEGGGSSLSIGSGSQAYFDFRNATSIGIAAFVERQMLGEVDVIEGAAAAPFPLVVKIF
jgi:hypothetical protein